MRSYLAAALIPLFVTAPVAGAEREVIKAGWAEFEREVPARKLEGRKAWIRTASGDEVQTKVNRVTDTGVVVRATSETRQWASGKKQATIPKDQIQSVRFLGRTGHRGLLGFVAGFGAGLGLGAAWAASQDAFQITEGPALIAVPAGIAAGAIGLGVAGYFIGRKLSRPAPEFILEP